MDRTDHPAQIDAVRPHDSTGDDVPTIDLDDVLRVGDHSVVLAPIEVRLLRAFLAHPGCVLAKDALARGMWPDGAPTSNSFHVRLASLRKRLTPFHISILTFPKRGYMLVLPDAERAIGSSKRSGARSTSTMTGSSAKRRP